jgi:hypothetical protein
VVFPWIGKVPFRIIKIVRRKLSTRVEIVFDFERIAEFRKKTNSGDG